MFTSRSQAIFDALNGEDAPIDAGDRAYFQSRLRNRIFDLILKKFVEQQKASGLTKAILARRIERAPAVITRYLSAPSNLTIETISDLILGICGEELDPISSSVNGTGTNMGHDYLQSSAGSVNVWQNGTPDKRATPSNDNSPLKDSIANKRLDQKNAINSNRWR